MKRKIKLRAWDKQNNKMCYPDAFFIFTGSEVLILNPHHKDNNYYQIENADDRFIQMQYIGLDDKNGKEIYEGDILLSTFTEDIIKVVEYKNFADVEISGIGFELSSNKEYLEIIGNIYQDKHLLK